MKLIILSLLAIQVVSSHWLRPCRRVEIQGIVKEAMDDVVKSLDPHGMNEVNRTCSSDIVAQVRELQEAVEDVGRDADVDGCILPLLAHASEVIKHHGPNIARRCPSNDVSSILREALTHTEKCAKRLLASCPSIRKCIAKDARRKEDIVRVVNDYTRCVLDECRAIQRDIQRIVREIRDCPPRTTPNGLVDTTVPSEPVSTTSNDSEETEVTSE